MIGFDNRVVIVTGAGGGLGRSYAHELARRGAAVVVNDLGGTVAGEGSGESAQRVVDEIIEAGGRAVASNASVATPMGGQSIVDTAIETYGRVDVVVNNAGILRDKSFAKLDHADLQAVLDVHLRGAVYVTQPAFTHMRKQGYGRLLFTSSSAGMFGNFGQTSYGAAKTGLVGLSNVLAIEGGQFGITSNVVMPVARTRMTEQLLGTLAPQLDPELVTPLAVYLCSEHCTLTHEVFSAAAGRYARVFVGVAPGWRSEGTPTAEDIADNLDTIREQRGYTVPLSTLAELQNVLVHPR